MDVTDWDAEAEKVAKELHDYGFGGDLAPETVKNIKVLTQRIAALARRAEQEGDRAGYRRGLERAEAMIPTSWLDPLLSGGRAALPEYGPWNCPDIERLLDGLRAALRREIEESTHA